MSEEESDKRKLTNEKRETMKCIIISYRFTEGVARLFQTMKACVCLYLQAYWCFQTVSTAAPSNTSLASYA